MEKKKAVISVIICICVSALLSFLIVDGIQIAMCDSLYYKLKTLEYEKHRLCYVLADNTSYEEQIDETKTRYILSMDMSFLKEASSDEETIRKLDDVDEQIHQLGDDYINAFEGIFGTKKLKSSEYSDKRAVYNDLLIFNGREKDE
jgi:hypothetical protein